MPRDRSILFVLLAAAACATGSTYRSGVGDRRLEHPPYYAGGPSTPATGRPGHLSIAYQRGATQGSMFDPDGARGTPIALLLAEMNRYLDSLDVTTRLVTGVAAPTGTPPDVRFSCETDPSTEPSGDCAIGDGRGDIVMHLAVGRPSDEWVRWAGGLMDSTRVAAVLVITLEVGQYRIRQRGFRGTKEVELGSGYVVRLPWLTPLEMPVNVLQITGAFVGRDGRAIRIGAEGMLARHTSLLESALGLHALITDEEVDDLRAARRDDLADRPHVWQAALRNLVTGLTGRP
jgi:hypothetical protein